MKQFQTQILLLVSFELGKESVVQDGNAKQRIETLAVKLLGDFQKRCEALDGKAIVVCMSRRNCVKLYGALTALPGCPEVKIVMTGNLSEDPKEWSEAGHITTKPQRDAIKARMKDINDPLKIVIVRDMWLTGTVTPPSATANSSKKSISITEQDVVWINGFDNANLRPRVSTFIPIWLSFELDQSGSQAKGALATTDCTRPMIAVDSLPRLTAQTVEPN